MKIQKWELEDWLTYIYVGDFFLINSHTVYLEIKDTTTSFDMQSTNPGRFTNNTDQEVTHSSLHAQINHMNAHQRQMKTNTHKDKQRNTHAHAPPPHTHTDLMVYKINAQLLYVISSQLEDDIRDTKLYHHI